MKALDALDKTGQATDGTRIPTGIAGEARCLPAFHRDNIR